MPNMRRRVGATKKNIFVIILIILTAGVFLKFPSSFQVTGMASSGLANVTISVAGAARANITFVSAISATDPAENGVRNITFTLTMYDPDGVADLNDSSVSANFSKANQATPVNSSCSLVGDIGTYSANYSCTIGMWYWYSSGNWNISITGNDLGNMTYVFNTSTWFTYNQLKAMEISPATLFWPSIIPASTNQTSSNDPLNITNTGNYNSTINVTALTLHGVLDPSYKIHAENFTTGLTTGAQNPECAGTALTNGTTKLITGSLANAGNRSAGMGLGLESFYYCIPRVPPVLMTQNYSTAYEGSWTISY